MSREVFPPIHRARLPRRGGWMRFRIGPLAVGVYRPRGDGADRWFWSKSWRFINEQGQPRHAQTFRRWLRRRSEVAATPSDQVTP